MSKLSNLLQDTNEAYYWAGFLAADGSFSGTNGNRLRLSISTKDEDHLIKFSSFIGSTYGKGINNTGCSYIYTSKQCKNIIPLYKEKFDFKYKKTYNPPVNLHIENDDFFLSFLIGFIDGDGCIGKQTGRKDSILQIKCHESWSILFNSFLERLSDITNIKIKSKINFTKCKNYCIMNLGNHKILHFLKNKTKELDIPVLTRKWDNIDLSYIADRDGKSKERFNKIKELKTKGLSIKDIAKEVGLSYSGVYMKLYRAKEVADESE